MHPSNAEGHHSCRRGRKSLGAIAKSVIRPPARPGWGPKCCGAGLILQAKPAILGHLGLRVLVSCWKLVMCRGETTGYAERAVRASGVLDSGVAVQQ